MSLINYWVKVKLFFYARVTIDHNGDWSTKYNSSVYAWPQSSETIIIVPNEYANYTLNSQIPCHPHHNPISFPSTNIKLSKDVFMTRLWSIIKPIAAEASDPHLMNFYQRSHFLTNIDSPS